MKTARLLFTLVLALSALDAHSRCSAPALTAGTPLRNGSSGPLTPAAITTGDFNGDGRNDLALATKDEGVWIALAKSGGGYNALTRVSTISATDITSADLNGDNRDDIVFTSNATDDVRTLMSNGNGTFTSSSTDLPSPHGVRLADLNGDKKLDLIVTSDAPPAVFVFLGHGTSTWGTLIPMAMSSAPKSLEVADIDGDGKRDLITALALTIEIRRGNGDGSFKDAATTIINTSSLPVALLAADLDDDGKSDLVAINALNNSVSVFRNRNGGLTLPLVYPAPNPSAIAAGDFLGRGRVDLAIAQTTHLVSVLASNGDGTFDAAKSFTTAGTPNGIAAIDNDQDGRIDVALSNASATGGIDTLDNVCGKSQMTIASHALVTTSSGDSVKVTVASYASGVTPTGTVTLKEGNTTIASAALVQGKATLATSSLSQGNHTFVINYGGDSLHDASTSSSFVIRATTVTSSITLDVTPTSSMYGTPVRVTPTITASSGTPNGKYQLLLDGVPFDTQKLAGQSANIQPPVGAHVLTAEYLGDTNVPYAVSPPVVVTVSITKRRAAIH